MAARSSPLIGQLLLVLGVLAWAWAPARLVSGPALRVREVLRRDRLSEADYGRMEQGYYGRLLDAGRQLDALGSPAAQGTRSPGAPAPVAEIPFDAGPLTRAVSDLREFVLTPGLSATHQGVRWSTNSLGLRDRPYAAAKPPGTVRIALVGDSIGAAWGVSDGRGFEPLWEQALDERSRAAGGPAVEVLNFAVPGYAPGQRWAQFSRVGWATGPDLVLYEATLADPGWDERRLRGLLARGVGWDSPLYRAALQRARARPGGTAEHYRQVLRPARWDILKGVYRTVVADCRARGVPSVWFLIPRVGRPTDPVTRDRLIALARRAGFAAVLDLSDAFDGLEPESLAISPSDYHPNAEGHRLLARRLDAALRDLPELRRLLAPTGPPNRTELRPGASGRWPARAPAQGRWAVQRSSRRSATETPRPFLSREAPSDGARAGQRPVAPLAHLYPLLVEEGRGGGWLGRSPSPRQPPLTVAANPATPGADAP